MEEEEERGGGGGGGLRINFGAEYRGGVIGAQNTLPRAGIRPPKQRNPLSFGTGAEIRDLAEF
jgi:hypothetical protein